MGELAFLYPGQGSQKVGMGADLSEARPELYDRYLSMADAASGLPIRQYSLEGPIEALTETNAAQPALFALSLAVTDAARELGLQPSVVAGHSLGEYTAAVASGALSLEDGMRLVSLRGRLMAAAQSERPGTMAAVIGLEADTLEQLCQQASEAGPVAPANYNTPSQTVVSGDVAGVERLMTLAEEAGAAKVVRLQVGAAFHSELMQPTRARMAENMESVTWREPQFPLVSNASGKLVTGRDQVHQALIDQIASPVRWVDCVRALADSGVTTFLELGSGRVLTGLVRQILGADTDVFAADSPSKLEEFVTSRPAHVGG
ncbi:MAG: ACP S-malonyltransferase [Actinobacteria bacterium]|nr:ACP S-malonyltransferase [Actinomycetota bacterium]